VFAVFATQKQKDAKNVVINCLLILQPCLVEIFELNIQSFIISKY